MNNKNSMPILPVKPSRIRRRLDSFEKYPQYPLPILDKRVKAFLIAAGEGTRLRPITYKIPKCLLPVNGMPMLEIWIRYLWLYGVKEIIINTCYLSKKVETFLKKKKWFEDVAIIHEKKLSGTAGIVADNKDKIQDCEDFFVIYADMLTNMSLYDMYKFHKAKGALATIAVKREKLPHAGVVVVDKDSRVTDFEEKPKKAKSNLSNLGICILNKKMFKYFPRKRPLDFGYDIWPRMHGKIAAFKTESYVLDIGSKKEYERAQKEWMSISLI